MATKKKVLTRDKVRQAPDIEYEYVEVPEWGGTARVRGLTGTECDAYEASLVQVVPSSGRPGTPARAIEPVAGFVFGRGS